MASSASNAQRQQQQKQYHVRFPCTFQGYQGVLEADVHGCKFNHDLIKADFPWESVKSIRIMTKHVKDIPTSVLAIKTVRQKQFSSMFLSNSKHYFYGFDDIVGVLRELIELRSCVGGAGIAPPADSNNLRASKVTAPLAGENSNVVHSRVSPTPSPNVCNNRVAETASPLSRTLAPNGGGGAAAANASFVASPIEEENSSSVSAAQLKNTVNLRDDMDEEVDKRSGGGVNMPLFVNKSRHAEQRECPSLVSQSQRHGTGNGQQKKRRSGQDISNDYRFVRWEHNLSISLSYFPRGVGGILLGILIVVALLLLSLLLMMCFSVIVTKLGLREVPLQEKINRLLQGLELLQEWQQKQQNEFIEANLHGGRSYRGTNMIEPTLKPPVRVTLSDMTSAVKELLGRYVNVQREMDAVRLHRVRRELSGIDATADAQHRTLEGIVITATSEDEGEDDDDDDRQKALELSTDWLNVREGNPKPRRFSLESVAADLRRWRQFFHNVIAIVNRLFWGRSGGQSGSNQPLSQEKCKSFFDCSSGETNANRQLIRYSEVLHDGQTVVEDVVPEDAEERRKCLHLSRKLVRLAELLEAILLKYQEVVMAPQYEAFLRQVPPTSSSSLSGRSTHDSFSGNLFAGVGSEDDGMLTGQSSHLLRSILLRRQTIALLQLEPLKHWDSFQYEKAARQDKIRSTLSLKSFSNNNKGNRKENEETSKEKPTRKGVEDILRDFVRSLTRRDVGDSWLILRNIMEEVRYWYDHEEDWQTLVLWKLNVSRDSSLTDNVLNSSNDDFDSMIAKIPVFRGLWCFLDEPVQLERGKKKAEDQEKLSAPASIPANDIPSTNMQSDGVLSNMSNGKNIIREGNDGAGNYSGNDDMITFRDFHNALWREFEVFSAPQEKEQEYLTSNTLETTLEGDLNRDEIPVPTQVGEENLWEDADDSDSGYDTAYRRVRQFELMTLDVQLRWVNAFELFLLSHESAQSTWNCNEKRSRYLGLGDYSGDSNDGNADLKEMYQSRRRILSVLGKAEIHYGRHLLSSATLTSRSSGALIDFVRESAERWKASWLRFIPILSWLVTDGAGVPLQCLLWRMQPADPTVRRFYREILRVPLGEAEDIPWMLLHLLNVPPDMLREHHNTWSVFKFTLCLLVLFLVASLLSFTVL